MIYTIYEKVTELSEKYQLCDYLTYVLFVIFIGLGSLSIAQ